MPDPVTYPDPVTHTDVLARCEAMVPALVARAEEAEALRRLPEATVADPRAAGRLEAVGQASPRGRRHCLGSRPPATGRPAPTEQSAQNGVSPPAPHPLMFVASTRRSPLNW